MKETDRNIIPEPLDREDNDQREQHIEQNEEREL